MDQERERILADLRGLLDGEVRCDDLFLRLYASDASVYEILPLAVVRPISTGDVIACVEYAAENRIPLHARGAGTGLSGESLGRGIVIDFSYSMRRVIDVGSDTVRVQPGVVHGLLNDQLAKYGRLFGPDPATSRVSTIGGVLGLDSSGSHWLTYGSARDRIESMQIVLPNGQQMDVSRHTVGGDGRVNPERNQLVNRLSRLIEQNEETIAANRPDSRVNRSGYHLYDVLHDGQLDLARLLVGSEGTLALITEATLRTDPLPSSSALALLFFDRLENAALGSLVATEMGASACDLLDRRLLILAREDNVQLELLIPATAEAMLLVEFTGENCRQQIEQLVVRLMRRKKLAFDARMAFEADEIALFWELTRRVIPRLYRLKGSTRPLPFVEDVAVAPERLPEFLVELQNVLKVHEVTSSLFAHVGHGQLHIRPFLDLGNDHDVRKMQRLANDLYQRVIEFNGTISGEHGDGLSRTWFVRRQYGDLYDVFREVKRTFDPHNIFNPGKVVADFPAPLTSHLRPVAATSDEVPRFVNDPEDPPVEGRGQIVPLQLQWQDTDITYAARSCNGCGGCRSQSADERMCPMFRLSPREEATPRAKANLMRGVLTGNLDLAELTSDEAKSVADLCVNCHQCRLECPASVDIPKLMFEAKAQYVATNGLSLSDWFLSHVERLSAWGSMVASVANWAIGNRQMRWVIEKLFGIAQGRKLPRFAARSFLRMAQRKRIHRPTKTTGRKVLYFVDVFANWHDVELAEAFVSVLQHNNISVYVPGKQYPAGATRITLGAADDARKLAQKNVAILADAVRQGYHIVTTEPSAALCLKHEYLNLLAGDDARDARVVAENTSEACDYLWQLHTQGQLELDLKPLNVQLAYHQPCHMRALNVGSPGRNLLTLILGIVVRQLDKGCSGMAGTFGLTRKNYRSSLRAGWSLISTMRESSIQAGTTECTACKMQMEQGTSKPTIHPLKIMALAYGLMPHLSRLLTGRSGDLIIS